MLLKLYGLAWLVVAAAAGAVYLTGNLNYMSAAMLGFLISALAFGFMVGVLPWWVDRKYSWKEPVRP